MWTKSDSIDSIRFSKKDREDLLHEGWNELNLDNYGVYHIQDNRNDVDLAFSLVRQDNDLSIRVEGDNMSVDGNINTLSLLMYILPKHNQTTIQIDCPIQSYSGIVISIILILIFRKQIQIAFLSKLKQKRIKKGNIDLLSEMIFKHIIQNTHIPVVSHSHSLHQRSIQIQPSKTVYSLKQRIFK